MKTQENTATAESQRAAAREGLRAGPKIPDDSGEAGEIPSGADAENTTKAAATIGLTAIAEWLAKAEVADPGTLERMEKKLAARKGLQKTAGPKVPQASPDERTAYVQGKVMEALDTYRPSYQRKILERCIAELPADTDDDEPTETESYVDAAAEGRAAKIQEVADKLATCTDELFDLTCRTVRTVCDREATKQDGDEPVDEDAGEQAEAEDEGEHQLTVRFFESFTVDEILAAVGLTIALASDTRGISEIANRYCNQFETQIKRAASQLMANETVTALECDDGVDGAKIMFVAGLLENR